METSITPPPSLVALTATINGDLWWNADSCAYFLGMLTHDGKPNRRKFYNLVKTKPDFPAPLIANGQKSWLKSEVDAWSKTERGKRQAERARQNESRSRKENSSARQKPSGKMSATG